MTILVTHCRQVNVAKICGFRQHFIQSVDFMSCNSLRLCSSNMSKRKIFVTRPDVPAAGLNMLKERFDVSTWSEERPVPREELVKQLQGKDALFCMLTDKIDKELLDNAGKHLKVIGTMSVGYDHIDVAEVRSRGIRIGYTPDVLTDAVAELTVALLMATSRRLFEGHQQILDGKWSAWAPTWMCGVELKHSTVGIVGFGRIGQGVARRLNVFSVNRILYSGRSEKPEGKEIGATHVSFDDLVSESDFIIVTCALTPETKEMFNDAVFAKMKQNVIFINTSRGGFEVLMVVAVKSSIFWDVMPGRPLKSTNVWRNVSPASSGLKSKPGKKPVCSFCLLPASLWFHAWLILNNGNRGVVDQPALQRALENRTILGAGLDVTTPEPLPPTHPLLQLKNCVIVPHIGSATTWTRGEMCILTARNIIAALDDKPMPAEVL